LRDYTNFDKYITQLQNDVYPQPPDPLHQYWGDWIINQWTPLITGTNRLVLDVGCGQGQFQPAFVANGFDWVGITLGTDFDICYDKGYNVYQGDFSFLDDIPDGVYGTVFARHALEHSPFPVLTLMEWRRISAKYLFLVLPNPEHFQFFGKNHYSVMTNSHALWLTARAGWKPLLKDYRERQELRYLFEKAEPRTELMWESENQLENEYGSHR
jgi:SAM-dependent methyltransferase